MTPTADAYSPCGDDSKAEWPAKSGVAQRVVAKREPEKRETPVQSPVQIQKLHWGDQFA